MTEWLTVEQTGARIQMSPNYVSRQCASGALKAKKLGSTWRISTDALEVFMGETTAAPAARKRMSARQMRRAS